MAESSGETVRKSPRGLRIAAWVLGVLVLGLMVVYFVATSAGFLKAFILPKVSQAMNAQVTVEDASISPFSQVVLRGLKVQTTGTDPLLTAREAVVRYRLSDILGGNYKVDELRLEAPIVNLVQNPDGSSNLDPILKEETPATSQPAATKPAEPAGKPAEPRQPSQPGGKPAEPMKVELRQIVVKDGIIRQIQLHTGGGRDQIELAPVQMTISDVKNGQTGKLALTSNVKLDQNPPAPGTNGQMEAKLEGNFDFTLTGDLQPEAIRGHARLDVAKAAGAYADLTALAANLDCDVTPTEIKQLALRFQKNNAGLGELRAQGPFDMNQLEGRLNVQVLSIDRQVLNLAGAPFGVDFGTTVINSTNQVELAKNGNLVTVAGRFNADRFSITRTNQTTPPIDLRSAFNVTVDQTQQTALLREFTVNGTQNQQPLLLAELSQPMSVAWGSTNSAQALPDSALSLVLTNFNLADWKAFAGDFASAGSAHLAMKLNSKDSGKRMEFDLVSRVEGLAAKMGANELKQSTVNLQARGQATEMNQIDLSDYRFMLAQQDQAVLSAAGSGKIKLDSQDADLQVNYEAMLPQLLRLMPQPDLGAVAGATSGKLHVTQQKETQTVTGTMTLSEFTGSFGSNQFVNLGAAMDVDILKQGENVEIRKTSGSLRHGNNPAATFDVKGKAVLGTNSTDADLEVVLEAMLPAFLQAVPQPGITATAGNAQMKGRVTQKGNAQSVVGTLALANYTGVYQEYKLDDYGATFDVDATTQGDEVQIRKATGVLRQANNPGGSFDLKGTVNLAKNAGQIDVKLSDLNQHGIGPFLAPSLGDKKIASVLIQGTASTRYDLAGESSVKADAQMSNLVVIDPANQVPAKPLEAKLALDAGMKKQVLDLRRCQLALSPTERASNAVELKGQVDMTQTNATQGALKLTAEALDVTPYYDLFTAAPATNAPATAQAPATSGSPTTPAAPAPAAAPSSPAKPAAEPETMRLPFQNFKFEAGIGHFYLRELDLADVQMAMLLDVTNVVIKPLQFSLNGGPATGEMAFNLGVPGYQYDLALQLSKAPLAPLANSFAKDYQGRAQGDLALDMKIAGVGSTGESLQKTLQGHFNFNVTNAVIQLSGAKAKRMIQVLAIGLRLPELAQSPVNQVNLQTTMGEGKIDIKDFLVAGEAFKAGSQGTITIASQLTNSVLPNLPVNVAISRRLMEKVSLVPKDTPTNAVYVQLPAIYKVGGTLGAPDPKFDAVTFGAYAARVAAGLPSLEGSDTGKLLQGFSDLLNRNKAGSTNAASTNSPSGTTTNQSPVSNLLDMFRKKK